MTNLNLWVQDEESSLDYQFDWTDWLEDDESITNYGVTATAGLTVTNVTEAAGIITAWIAGGTSGEYYEVRCEITTDAGRVDARTERLGTRAAALCAAMGFRG